MRDEVVDFVRDWLCIRVAGMTHVRTSPYYPQSSGKLERYNRTVETDFRRS